MQNATCYREDASETETGSVSDGRPAWCSIFLAELRRQSRKHAACNTRLAAELAGIDRSWLYKYSKSDLGRTFRMEWDLIVLEARRFHSFRHR